MQYSVSSEYSPPDFLVTNVFLDNILLTSVEMNTFNYNLLICDSTARTDVTRSLTENISTVFQDFE